jgi:hypothetical protein
MKYSSQAMESRIFTISICGQIENLHVILPSHHEQQFSIKIWVGISADNLFGSHARPDRHTELNYKGVSVISGTGVAFCTADIVAQCNDT